MAIVMSASNIAISHPRERSHAISAGNALVSEASDFAAEPLIELSKTTTAQPWPQGPVAAFEAAKISDGSNHRTLNFEP
jgi:hypothetical protein